jgi:hypothetical protein
VIIRCRSADFAPRTHRRPANRGSKDGRYRGNRGGGSRTGRRTSLRAGSASQVFTSSRRCPKTKPLVTGLERARASDMPSKSVGGRKLAGGFDSRPPPLKKPASDQRRSTRAGRVATAARARAPATRGSGRPRADSPRRAPRPDAARPREGRCDWERTGGTPTPAPSASC